MAQYKKDKVKETIDWAAMEVFSHKGYMNTKIADISKLSGVSVGNIYRYYNGKDDIFYSLIPQAFFDVLQKKLTEKISYWGDSVDSGKRSGISQAFVDFMIGHKRQFLILFGGCQGTRYENMKGELVKLMTEVFISNYADRLRFPAPENKKVITVIYEKHIETMVAVFSLPLSDEELRNTIKLINDYHVTGITGFLLPETKKEGK